MTLFQQTLQLAGFQEWNLLYEDEALSYQYGFMHSLHWKEEYEDTVLFVDVGYDHCGVYVTEFKEHSTRLLFSQTSRVFSGYQIDRVIGAIAAEELNETNVTLENETASRRAALTRSCEECKRYFTPDGTDTYEMKVNFENADRTIRVERRECEERCEERLIHLIQLCQQAVECCPGIRSVVLEGGASRVTMVRNAVNSVIQKLDHPVNFKWRLLPRVRCRFTGTADEDVCRGCSIYSYVRSLMETELAGAQEATENDERKTDDNPCLPASTPMYVDTSTVSTQTPPKPIPLDEDSDMAIQYRFIVNRDNQLLERRALIKRMQVLLAACRKAIDPNALYSWVQEVNMTLDMLENTLNTSEEVETNDGRSEITKYQELESDLQRVKEEIDACNEKKQYIDVTLFPCVVYWNKQSSYKCVIQIRPYFTRYPHRRWSMKSLARVKITTLHETERYRVCLASRPK